MEAKFVGFHPEREEVVFRRFVEVRTGSNKIIAERD